jgi:hypothetical protein
VCIPKLRDWMQNFAAKAMKHIEKWRDVDPVTISLIAGAPPLEALDLEELPRRFTNVFAEIIAARVRLRGAAAAEDRSAALVALLDEMRRLAAAQELLVATAPERADRAAAAFVAGTAHQLCLMAEIIAAKDETRVPYIDAIRAAPEICGTLLFLIADSQSDAAEMAKRLVTDTDDRGAEARLIRAIGDLAAGRLRSIMDNEGDLDYERPADRSGGGRAVDALLRRLHAVVIQLAGELLTRPADDSEAIAVSEAQTIFAEVRDLCIAPIEDVFDVAGPFAVSVFPGPLHVAKLLLAVAGDLAEAGLCRVPAPSAIDANQWWRIIRRAANKRPYLWRNHRAALDKGFLTKGASAAVSFPTGGGKSTIAELKIAVALLAGGKIVVLAPTLALVDQTAFTLRNAFKDFSVFGDLDEDITFSDAIVLPEIIVTTPERCLMLTVADVIHVSAAISPSAWCGSATSPHPCGASAVRLDTTLLMQRQRLMGSDGLSSSSFQCKPASRSIGGRPFAPTLHSRFDNSGRTAPKDTPSAEPSVARAPQDHQSFRTSVVASPLFQLLRCNRSSTIRGG